MELEKDNIDLTFIMYGRAIDGTHTESLVLLMLYKKASFFLTPVIECNFFSSIPILEWDKQVRHVLHPS